ncbi:TetR/AcrR family transcriptional regulator [Sutcliffiella horikoshii]|uniref:TetR/AcrR family transcriptional regulator n=1 Tax=Sutcliffiella horikoshii TaxID=79883 RepID=UPI00384E351F
MAKGFTDQERDAIQSKLMKNGRELFEKFGLKKTSMSQLTKSVGIAQGSFYLFFSSKEELYFSILEKEEGLLKEKILQQIESPMTAGAFKNLLMLSVRMVEENSFIQQLFKQEEMEQLIRKLPSEKLQQHIKKDTNDLTPLIEIWQKEGSMVQESPEVISGAFRSMILLAMHKREIGEGVYDSTMELIAEGLANRLFKEEQMR